MDNLREYAALANEKADLDARLTVVEARMQELRPGVLEWFAREGVQSVALDGRTLYLRRELWASRVDGVSHEVAAAALAAAGIGEFAAPRVNTQRLSAWCREREANGEAMPPEFDGVIKVIEAWKVGSTKA